MAAPTALSKLTRALVPALLAVLVAGCDPGKENEAERSPRPAPERDPAPPPTRTESVAEEVDLTADKPGAGTTVKTGEKITVLLDTLEPEGPVNRVARNCYKLIADMKTNIEKINTDLDGGGKQVTRLIHTSDELCKNITELAGIWPGNEPFRDQCISAKRQALTLNDELSRVPRTWAHVRWAFSSTLKSVSVLRIRARTMAEAEPKPTVIVGKDGKVVLVEAEPTPVDPAIAKREENVKKAERMRAQMRKNEEEKKNKQMPLDLDSK